MAALISYLINLIVSIWHGALLQYRGITTVSVNLGGELLYLYLLVWNDTSTSGSLFHLLAEEILVNTWVYLLKGQSLFVEFIL